VVVCAAAAKKSGDRNELVFFDDQPGPKFSVRRKEMKVRRDLNNKDDYRDMVHWFSPLVLLKTLEKVLPSTMFARYADRRLVHAALDLPLDEENLIKSRCGGAKGICGDKESSEIWVDYVADLGDGFDSTYAIAYLIGQKEIQIGPELKLPRADCLIMGGDEVYPDASREDYQARMQRPYRYAFPIDEKDDAIHPPVFLIPGNHDWYDGLSLFLAKFCTGAEDNNLGSWRLPQSRSYFAVHLGHNWWIWGFDSQLEEDIDKPQSDYFTAIAKKMDPNAKVIICASVPTWLGGSLSAIDKARRDRFFRGLDYIAGVLRKHCAGARVPVVISGDLHHYSRYTSKESGTNFITAGGGGAFLHPTHFLVEDKIDRVLWAQNKESLEIGRDQSDETKKAIYPAVEKSRSLALGNLGFWYKNLDFCFVLGCLYFLCALLLLAWDGYGDSGGVGNFFARVWNQVNALLPTPVFLVIALVLFCLLVKAANIRSTPRTYFLGGLHAVSHVVIILFGTALVSIFVAGVKSVPIFGEILYFLALFAVIVFGLFGGVVWGIYLTAASWCWGDESNNAFSAMRLDKYRHFIRLKIEDKKLTIYPIGIDESPQRSDWKINDAFDERRPDQNTPVILPQKDLGHHLIEDPIVINIDQLTTLRAIR